MAMPAHDIDAFAGLRQRLSEGRADATDQAIAAAALLAFERADEERAQGWVEAFKQWRQPQGVGRARIAQAAFEAGWRAKP